MKIKCLAGFPLLVWLALAAFDFQRSTTFAQGASFTYQGRVSDNGTNFTGTAQLEFALVTSTNANQPAQAAANTPSGGYITGYTIVTGGSGYLTAPVVTVSGGGGSGAAAIAHIAGGVVTSIAVGNPGNGGYTSAPSVTIAPPPSNISYTTYWSNDGTSSNGSEPAAAVSVGVTNGLFTVVLGDTTVPNMAYLDSSLFTQPGLQLRIWFNDGVNGFAALSPVQNLTPAPYAIVANSVNEISAAQLGADPYFTGTVTADSFSDPNGSFVGGTSSTIQAGDNASTIGGGLDNNIGTNSYFATISGGSQNIILANARGAVIGGGENNQIGGGGATGYYDDSVIGGGVENSIGTNALAVIGGGFANHIGSGVGGYNFTATIGGGYNNTIGDDVQGAVIGGGEYNQIGNGVAGTEFSSTIAGGYDNIVGTNAAGAFIGGGAYNHIGNATPGFSFDSAIVGGEYNTVGTNVVDAFIGGGYGNQIGSVVAVYNNACAIGGGGNNSIGTNASFSVIGGGYGNVILGNSSYAAIPGGGFNSAGGSFSLAAGYNAFATNSYSFVWSDNSEATGSAVGNSVTFRASGGYRFFTGSGTVGAQLAPNSTAWSTISDRNAKKNFQAVDTVAVLDKLAAIPIQQWNYKWEKNTDVPNIGPMAQDFKAAFFPGRDDKSITTLEFDGVELAAIQGLNQKLQDELSRRDAENAKLKQQNDSLAERLNELEAAVKQLAAQK